MSKPVPDKRRIEVTTIVGTFYQVTVYEGDRKVMQSPLTPNRREVDDIASVLRETLPPLPEATA